ncbi:putative peroxidase-related enzyme [Bradyrhizobium sp. USDA 3686]|uniref:carboxymuconolactone decarboxylase family protein n=1 Tax=Bradyrhizobium canariense TaxID=255045 RepID=UPI00195BBE19|nr:carboxymuconolactone decarboxylase family protein [Bradyrhizobium canariense]MBM7488206.1 putative peroxidase-related enzyme [Bradyrhizobium canariense]
MSRLPVRTIDDAPALARPRLTAAQQNNGYLPNLLRVLANAPVALEAYQTLSAISTRASLSPAEREAVQITAAAIHGCGFCVAGHTAIAYKKIGLDEALVDALRDLGRGPDAKLNAVAEFTKAIIRSRGNVADRELADFLAAGFDEAAALEVVLGVGLATLCNFSNSLGRAELNPELTPYGRRGAEVEAAE